MKGDDQGLGGKNELDVQNHPDRQTSKRGTQARAAFTVYFNIKPICYPKLCMHMRADEYSNVMKAKEMERPVRRTENSTQTHAMSKDEYQ